MPVCPEYFSKSIIQADQHPIMADAEMAVPYLDSKPVRPDLEMAGSSPDPTGITPELSGIPPLSSMAELSPNPDRLLINSSNRVSLSTSVRTNDNVGTTGYSRTEADGSGMHPNMSFPGHNSMLSSPKSNSSPHVMSWMEYEGAQGISHSAPPANVSEIDGRARK